MLWIFNMSVPDCDHGHQLCKPMKTFRELSLSFCAYSFATLFCTNTTSAQKDLKTDQYIQEFFIGETVFPQEKHEIQFTLKPIFARRVEERQLYIPFEVEYGLSDRLQASLEVPYLFSFPSDRRTKRGMGDAELSLMYSILKNSRTFSLSAGASLPFHTAGDEFKEDDEVIFECFALIGHQMDNVQVHGNFVTEFTRGDIVFNYGVSSVFNFGRFNATLEIGGTKEDERIFNVSPGLIWNHFEGFEFGMAIHKSLTPSTRDWGLMGMITREFSVSRRKNKQADLTN